VFGGGADVSRGDGGMKAALLLTCEHGGNRVPRAWRGVAPAGLLNTHRGYDAGALGLAKALRDMLDAPLVFSDISRLLIDRSPDAPSLHHPSVARLPAERRAALVRTIYSPYRQAVRKEIERLGRAGRTVVHVGVHSFTPMLRGVRRRTDIGLLFDPRRRGEHEFCAAWRRALATRLPGWRIDFNRPYRGTDDGLTTTLRSELSAARYLGIELEVKRTRLVGASANARRVAWAVGEALGEILAH
jgi:predicted N-formylglutamate amidohydrolase